MSTMWKRFSNGYNSQALAEGIKEYLSKDMILREASVRQLATAYDWSNVIRPVAEEIKKLTH